MLWKQKTRSSYYNQLHVVKLSGGLGNQMFQYALYKQLKNQGKCVKIDDVTEYQGENSRPKQLQTAFSLAYECCTKEELTALTDAYLDPVSRIRRKLFGRRTRSYQEKQFNYDAQVFQQESTYYEGCWQTEKYFKGIEKELRKDFTFQCDVPKETMKYLKQIKNTESVSIHIRRGDYLNSSVQSVYGNICTEDYYEKAIKIMKQELKNPVFFLFTNDIPYVREHMRGEEYVVVDCNQEETGYLDLLLMSQCRNNIIANSSFSWWGAWLNENINKKVIAPDRWLNHRDCSDIYLEGMIKIEK